MPEHRQDDDSERDKARDLVGRGWEALRPRIPEDSNEQTNYSRRIAAALRREEIDLDELEASIAALEEAIFGRPPFYGELRRDVNPDDSQIAVLVDSLRALTNLEEDDPAHAWNTGQILFAIGRHDEAASAFLMALARHERDEDHGGDSSDWADWRASMAYHAAKNLVLADSLLSASLLLPQLSAQDHAEILAMLEARLESRRESDSSPPPRPSAD